MNHNPDRHHRRSIRLSGYDYSQAGAYFVTVCAKDRACLFGEVADGVMRPNDAGRMVADVWVALPARFPTVQIDEFVVMPNHVHGIVVLNDHDVGAPLVGALSTDKRAGTRPAPTDDIDITTNGVIPIGAGTRPAPTDKAITTPTLGDIVGAFKSITTDDYIVGVRQNDWPAFSGKLWQRNYYEHIIRDDESFERIRQYIMDNPPQWESDRENPSATYNESSEAWQR
jgi:putative transposase